MADAFAVGVLDRLVGLYAKCELVSEIRAEMTLERLRTDRLHQLALSKAIELIGENAASILRKYPSIDDDHPQLSLKKIVALRNILVHGYETISFDQLWGVATINVPQLQEALAVILREVGEDVP